MKNKVKNPHDRLFKASLKDPQVAKEFLTLFLPEDIKKDLDLTNLTYCNSTFIDEELKLTESDVLFSTTLLGKPAFIYLLCEHQSTVDLWMPFRMLKYLIAIWEMHITQKTKEKALPLPLIFPLIFYTGKKNYHGKTAASS